MLTLAITKIQENKNLINAISHKELSKAFLHVASKNMANFKYTQFYITLQKKKKKNWSNLQDKQIYTQFFKIGVFSQNNQIDVISHH